MRELLKTIANLYDIPEIKNTEKVKRGFLSENYKLSTNANNYFLKKYRFDNEKKIKDIHLSKKYFSDNGIPVIMPIKTKTGVTYFKQGSSYFTLFQFISKLQPDLGYLNDEMITSMGKMLGKMHLIGKNCSLKLTNTFDTQNNDETLKIANILIDKILQLKTKTNFDKLALKTIIFKKKLIEKNNIEYKDLHLINDHLIHGDYLDSNIFFGNNNEVKYIFDFEKIKYAPKTHELFRSVIYSFLTDFNKISIEKIKLYIKSYLEICPIDKKELKNGFIAHYTESMHNFWVEKEHYLKGNNRVDLFLEPNYKRLKFTSENLETLIQELCL